MQTDKFTSLNINASSIHYNECPAHLIKYALANEDCKLTDRGAIAVRTGKYTGRSPEDKYIVDTDGIHDMIHWSNVNRPVSRNTFNSLKEDILRYLDDKEIFVFEGFAGADTKYTRKFRIINEKAWQNLFVRNLLIRPNCNNTETFGEADYTILAVPGYKCDFKKYNLNSEVAVMIDYESHFAIIAGTEYAGEIKKAIFSIMNFVLPVEENVLPMHCSANMAAKGDDTAVFFGLSGTGKTTLSTSPNRKLIGDDEHGWSAEGVFNIEGGCYAKCIDLKESEQPDIYNAVKFGAVAENVVIDNKTGTPDFSDRSLTENTRVGYPVDYIPNSELSGKGGIPKAIFFLTADAFGVLPPISRLSRNAALYHFITGFTAKVAGTERGINEPKPTFSTLFGEPFMPLPAEKYAQMLGERLDSHDTQVFLVNTGWTSGSYGEGSRIKLKYTRAMISAAIAGDLDNVEYRHDDLFNLDIPQSCPDVPAELLNPRETWKDKEMYDTHAQKLAIMFEKNFQTKYPDMPSAIANAGPRAII